MTNVKCPVCGKDDFKNDYYLNQHIRRKRDAQHEKYRNTTGVENDQDFGNKINEWKNHNNKVKQDLEDNENMNKEKNNSSKTVKSITMNEKQTESDKQFRKLKKSDKIERTLIEAGFKEIEVNKEKETADLQVR